MLSLLGTLRPVRQMLRYQNDRIVTFQLFPTDWIFFIFEIHYICAPLPFSLWDTSRSFSQERAFFETKTVANLKMTAKCPMGLDFQKLKSAYSCAHFDT